MQVLFEENQMTKQEAINLFGTGPIHLARGLGLSKQAINGWPFELTQAQEDRVMGAYYRQKESIPASR
jgi:hypothetical protein